jgi:hypothetical protein
VLWARSVGKQTLGPYTLSARTKPLGRLELLARNADVAPQRHVEGTAAFAVSHIPGVSPDEEGSDFVAPEPYYFYIRLTDNLTGAEHIQPLEVQRPSAKPS